MKTVEENLKTVLDYNAHMDDLPQDAFRISASQLSQFMSHPHKYYREKILNEDGFKGNTASVLGTVVHYVAEKVAKNEPVDENEIEKYIDKHLHIEDFDAVEIRNQYKGMSEALVNQYILRNKPDHAELPLNTIIMPYYYAGCTIDAIQSDILIDYKTYNSKTKPKSIPMNYKYQLLENVFVARANGYEINRMRLVYINRNIDGGVSEKTGRQLKSYPPEVTVLTDDVTEEDMEFIESVIKLCAESVDTAKKHPELAYLIFRDYRLKGVQNGS